MIKTREDFIEELFKKCPDERDTIEIIEYSGYSKPIRYRCKVCGTEASLKIAGGLLTRHSNIICKTCTDPLTTRRQQVAFTEKAMSKMKNSPTLTFVSLEQKEVPGNRRRLAITYTCNICNQESQVFVKDVEDDHYTCKHCAKNSRWTPEDFKNWMEKEYPNFIVLHPEEYQLATSRIHIKCKKCGFIFYPSATNLKRAEKVNCPKCRGEKSNAEMAIADWLINYGISFDSEKIFDWLPGRRYDFYIPEYSLLIEYDGEQHSQYVPHFHRNEEGFLRYQEIDRIKTEEALKHNYCIFRIPHIYETKIPEILNNLFGSTTILKGSRGKCLEINDFLNKEEDIV